MLHEFSANGNVNGHTLECASDHEPYDPSQHQAMPGWRNQHPKYVHHVEWVDADNRKHGITLRTDDREEMLATLRCVKSALAPQSPQVEDEPSQDDEPPADEKPNAIPCPVHPHDLAYLRNGKNGAQFYSHRLDDGTWCNCKEKK